MMRCKWTDAFGLQWDPSNPSVIGSPLRIGSQEFDELAEVVDVFCI